MSNQIQNPNVKMFFKTISYLSFSRCASSPVQAAFGLMGGHFFKHLSFDIHLKFGL
jgi:hypothetical protein